MSFVSSSATILVVDDTPAHLVLVREHLEQAGYRVVVVQNGEETIQRAEFVRPDLILLDVQMPDLTGFETCQRLKQRENTQDIPVIFMIAQDHAFVKVTAFDVGGVDYVTKPVEREEVLARANTHVTLRAMQQLLETRNQQLRQKLRQQEKQLQELERRATHDMLTGLANGTLFRDRLNHAIEQARQRDTRLGMLLIGLDRFKVLNDHEGYSTGDEVLKAVAARLSQCVRKSDTLARLGSDEFAILIEAVRAPEELEQLAGSVCDVLAQPMLVGERRLASTCSVGVSQFPQDGESAEKLLSYADAAMYQAKKSGRNTFRFFDSSALESGDRQASLERRLYRALDNDEFVLAFQPQVDLRTGRLCGLEALIRWQSPEEGLVLPGEFIPVAEESRLILALGEWVLKEACRQIRAWLDAGLPVVPVAINLAAAQFAEPHFDQVLAQILADHQVEAHYLALELTESMSMSNPERSIKMMHRLKGIGVSLVIDDFGIGFSNLSYLKRLPLDKLKIDRTFVSGLIHSPGDGSIVRSVIRLAHSLGLQVVAEGVESVGQVRVLAEEGCDSFQGYYFKPALCASDLPDLLRDQAGIDPATLVRQTQEGTVLLVEDEKNVINSFVRLLRGQNIQLLAVSSAKEAYEILACQEIQVVVSDFRMPDQDGVCLLGNIKQLYPRTVRILMTGHVDTEMFQNTINQAEVFKFIAKPWSSEQVIGTLHEAFRRYNRRTLP